MAPSVTLGTEDHLPEPDDLRDLIQQALAGQPDSVRTLVERLSPVIAKRVAATLWQRRPKGNIPQESADMIQEVFLSLFQTQGKALRAWDPARGMSLDSFVGLLAQHQVISLLRNGRTSAWREEPTESEQMDTFPGPARTPDSIISSRDYLRHLLDRVRDNLSPRGLELFQRIIIDEEAVETLIADTGLTRDALYQWKSRLLRLVRTLSSEIDAPRMSEPAMALRMVKGAPQT
jgi:DNA-directed RNA polymerase specialized sigma24 family protein